MPKLLNVFEILPQIILCPVGRNVESIPGWKPDCNNVIASMTILPPPDAVTHRPGYLATDVWLELQRYRCDRRLPPEAWYVADAADYLRAPAAVLMDHYARRHGRETNPEWAVQQAMKDFQVAMDLLPADAGDYPEACVSAFVGFWSAARRTILESTELTIPIGARVRVVSSQPIDAIAVLEVMARRPIP